MPRLFPLGAPLVPLCALFSTGCASPPVPVALPRPSIPASLLTCQPQPEPPRPDVTDAVLAGWIVDLAAAGQDCRDRLRALASVAAPDSGR